MRVSQAPQVLVRSFVISVLTSEVRAVFLCKIREGAVQHLGVFAPRVQVPCIGILQNAPLSTTVSLSASTTACYILEIDR